MNPQNVSEAANSDPSDKPDAPRERRDVKRTSIWYWVAGIFAGSVIACIVAYLIYAASASNRLEAVRAKLDAEDPGWRWKEILAHRKVVDDAENSAILIAKVNGLKNGEVIAASEEARLVTPEPNRSLAPVHVELLREGLTRNKAALAEAKKLKTLRWGRFPLQENNTIFSIVLTSQDARSVARLLNQHATYQAELGNLGQALEACQALDSTSRSIGDEPFMISALIRVALSMIASSTTERVLAQGEPPLAELRALRKAFEESSDEDLYRIAMRGERAALDAYFDQVRSGRAPLGAVVGGGPTALNFAPLAYINGGRIDTLELMTEQLRAGKLPPAEGKAIFTKIENDLRSNRFNLITKLIMPSSTKVYEATMRGAAMNRAIIAGLAAEEFRQTKKRWPSSLKELTDSKILEKELLDPFDGKSLRMKPLEDGLAIYSVGPDLADNDGKLNRFNPIERGTDLGVRLWNLDHRRLPPLPSRPEEAPPAP